jgi:hypothetical protein
MKAVFDPVQFVARHGIVLASAKGPVPNLAEVIAREPIRGSWWGHPRGSEIFQALGAVDDSPDVLCFRLVHGKITFVHRRLWPALVRLAEELGKERLTVIQQEHTSTGAHRNVLTPFPKWVSKEVADAARLLSRADARALIGPSTQPNKAPRARRSSRKRPRRRLRSLPRVGRGNHGRP